MSVPKSVYTNKQIKAVVAHDGCMLTDDPSYVGEVERALFISVSYLTANGENRQERLEGFEARVFQHECDHLDGVLFVDHLKADHDLVEQTSHPSLLPECWMP